MKIENGSIQIRSYSLYKQAEEQKWCGEEGAVVTIQDIDIRWWPASLSLQLVAPV
jgi:hypothetical protein